MNLFEPTTPRPAPLSLPMAALRVARIAPFQVLRGKRLLALLLLGLSPVAAVLLMRIYGASRGLGVRGFVDFSSGFYLSVSFPVTLLFLGAGAIGDDIDNGTLLYMRLRPVNRAAIVCGRYLAACLSAMVLLSPFVILLYVTQVGWHGVSSLVEQLDLLLVMLGIVALASLAYGAFFLLLSMLLRHAVIIGLFFVAGWEVLVAIRLPTKAALLTVSFHLRSILWHSTSEGRTLNKIMGRFDRLEIVPDVGESVMGLLLASLVLLLLTCFVFARKEYLEKPGDS